MATVSHLIAGFPRLGPLPVKALTRETNEVPGRYRWQASRHPGRPNRMGL